MTGATGNMPGELDTRRLERRMLLYYTQDGLWDLFVGVCAVSWSLLLRIDLVALVGAVCGMAAVLVIALKQRITYPRVGYARFRSAGASRGVIAGSVGFGAACLLIVLTVRSGMAEVIRPYFPVWMGLAIGALIAVAGWAFNARRFYLHGALIFLAGVAHQWGGVPLWLAVTIAGVVIVVVGAVVLARFLRNNPKVGVEIHG